MISRGAASTGRRRPILDAAARPPRSSSPSSFRPSPPPSSSAPPQGGGEFIKREGPHVVLKAGKARLFLEGNPLVFGEAVGQVMGNVADGDYVEVVDHRGNLIGKGW